MIERYLSPQEARRLLSALAGAAVLLGLAALFACLLVPGLRNANRPAVGPAQETAGEGGWLDPTDYPAARGYAIPPLDPGTVLKPTPELLERGRGLYTRNCLACHGAQGQGDGPAAAGLSPRPRDLSQAKGWKNGPGLPELYRTLSEGLKGTAMQAYSHLSRRDRMALAHQVQSLARFARPPEDPGALETLGRSFASGGEVIPNRIPVRLAMERITEEASTGGVGAERAAFAAVSGRFAQGLLAELVLEPDRALRVLAANPQWRRDPQALARLVRAGLPGNGFRPRAATLDPEGWRALHRELIRAVEPTLPPSSKEGRP